jgi:membrane protein required for colicin V production
MNSVDTVLLVVLLLSTALGLWRGLVYEVISVAGWVAAFVLAQAYAAAAAQWLPLEGFSPPLKLAAGFVLVFVGAAFAAGLLAWVVKKLVDSVGLRPVDRVLGAGFGLARGAVLLLALAVVVSMTPLKDHPQWADARGARVLSATLHEIKPVLPVAVARHLP